MVVMINGESVATIGESVEKYLTDAGYDEKRVVVELNETILPKSQYKNTFLRDGDRVEIVGFVGGG